ncbi:MAG: hypothetical protein ACP5NV_03150 [Candidatus Woesearchaeota archaeon]
MHAERGSEETKDILSGVEDKIKFVKGHIDGYSGHFSKVVVALKYGLYSLTPELIKNSITYFNERQKISKNILPEIKFYIDRLESVINEKNAVDLVDLSSIKNFYYREKSLVETSLVEKTSPTNDGVKISSPGPFPDLKYLNGKTLNNYL